ncbi:hypothetical protein HOK51_04825 [Candidatus Woesearchaeota archaeon]|jgi:hypothetical protein|nr:hypothetical protein [Candidatus Woesearchaeota archaeon]MBT6519149.1 hypothetical protein [Candidatus Woesearchaeota archaeon]MBT7367800.1 hypothetical protein [Candidatus Woesearchaeota archaeon]
MAANPKKQQKVRLDYNIDKQIYDDFVRSSSKKGIDYRGANLKNKN